MRISYGAETTGRIGRVYSLSMKITLIMAGLALVGRDLLGNGGRLPGEQEVESFLELPDEAGSDAGPAIGEDEFAAFEGE